MGVFEPSKGGGLILKKFEATSILADPAMEMSRLPQIRIAISELVQKLGLKKSKVKYSISGQSVFTRFVKLPALQDDNIEQLVTFEAQQHVPFPIDEVIWDWQELPSVGPEKEVVIVAIKGDALNEINDVVVEDGLSTVNVDASPMAIYNAFRYNYPEITESTLLIDIGAKTSNLIYTEGDRFFTRSVPVGGASITTAIAKEYGVSFSEAEAQKTANGLVALNTAYTSQLDEATAALSIVIRNALAKLPAEIARTTNYYRSQHGGAAPQRIIVAGGGANLRYVTDFLSDKLRLPVELFNPMKQVSVGSGVNAEAIASDAHTMGDLVGLALRGVDKAPLKIDLVPDAVAHERDIQKRKPMMLAAAAVVLAGFGAWAGHQMSMNAKAQDRYDDIAAEVEERQQYAMPLDGLNRNAEIIAKFGAQYLEAEDARTGWINRFNDLTKLFAHDQVWLFDVSPVSGWDPKQGEEMVLSPIVANDFREKTYGMSSLAPLNAAPAGRQRGARGSRNNRNAAGPAAAKGPKKIDALRVRGFWRGSRGFGEVYELVDKLKNSSTEFSFKIEGEKRGEMVELARDDKRIVRSNQTSLDEGNYAAPFELILPIAEPIKVPNNN
ncbi:type IV pilus assembly protein PilM [Persicirhabdus sediminis]|uniref:Type IV pilus assembly protein PilM n=2 Tax=Persicirhabdus sediminis TaxID=454144 RepID=A0A8J7SHC4_9BACT|nr:type IV pilus assembly protein PilM [Persicirhabdus sediminis]